MPTLQQIQTYITKSTYTKDVQFKSVLSASFEYVINYILSTPKGNDIFDNPLYDKYYIGDTLTLFFVYYVRFVIQYEAYVIAKTQFNRNKAFSEYSVIDLPEYKVLAMSDYIFVNQVPSDETLYLRHTNNKLKKAVSSFVFN